LRIKEQETHLTLQEHDDISKSTVNAAAECDPKKVRDHQYGKWRVEP